LNGIEEILINMHFKGAITMQLNSFYQDKNVFVTGHTGFKGSWLSIWLNHLGANVTGLSNDIKMKEGVFCLSNIGDHIVDERGDITNPQHLNSVFQKAQPEIVFHLAAQPLVRDSYEHPYITYLTNVIGTLNVLEGIRSCKSVKSVVIITTDKCYKNNEWVWGYRENDELGGHDPYSSSKACCEILVDSYRKSYFENKERDCSIGIATARAGNVIGGGDWAKDRIIPDCVRSIQKEQPIKIRNPYATRPWQHVLEPLGGYLQLATKLYEEPDSYSEAFNFGPESKSILKVSVIVEKFCHYFNKGSFEIIENNLLVHEANLLNLDINKSKHRLNWTPLWDIDEALQKTAEWYKCYKQADIYELCIKQIEEYQKLLSHQYIM